MTRCADAEPGDEDLPLVQGVVDERYGSLRTLREKGVTVDLVALRRLAEQATPGPWAWEQVRKFRDGAYGEDWVKLDRNHKFIAACDPQTVLALIHEAEASREREAWLRRQLDGAIEAADAVAMTTGLATARALLGDLRDARAAIPEEGLA